MKMPDYGCTRRQRKTRKRLKPEDAGGSPVAGAKRQAGAKQANAHSTGYSATTAAVASPKGKQPSD